MGDGFISTVVVLNGQLHTMFQREFEIELEHGDKPGGFWAPNRCCLVSKGVSDGRMFCTVSLWLS